MDLKYLYDMTNSENILEKYNLPYNFFTKPHKVLTEETCLNEILNILIHNKIEFPNQDTSDIEEFIENKNETDLTYEYSSLNPIQINHVNIPYIKDTNNNFIKLICFMRAYASHTYRNGNFKEYFKDVFDVFYSPL